MSTAKQFEGGVVSVNHDEATGEPNGSKIKAPFGVVTVPHWPSRIKDVRKTTSNQICVETKKGDRRYYGPDDTLAEAALRESKAGGSAGGHDPRAHGKIRYIVRSFGSWAKGKHSVCVSTIRTKHPEVAKGKNLNALCAWLKDQWAGSTKWRGSSKDSKQVAEDAAISSRAKRSAPARFRHAMPMPLAELSHAEIDMLVEDIRKMTGQGIGDLLREMDVELGDDQDPFVALFEHDALEAELTIMEAEAALRAGTEDPRPIVESWLAAHGDTGQVNPENLDQAIERIIGNPPLHERSKLDGRIMEAQGQGQVADPWERNPDYSPNGASMQATDTAPISRHRGEEEAQLREGESQAPVLALPPPPGESTLSVFMEGEEHPVDEVSMPPDSLLNRPAHELIESARKLYDRTAEPTNEGRSYLRQAGKVELCRIIVSLQEAMNRPRTGIIGAQPGDKRVTERKDSKDVTDISTVTPAPPNLRESKHPHYRCGNCFHFTDGTCRAYGVEVRASQISDSYSPGFVSMSEADRIGALEEMFAEEDQVALVESAVEAVEEATGPPPAVTAIAAALVEQVGTERLRSASTRSEAAKKAAKTRKHRERSRKAAETRKIRQPVRRELTKTQAELDQERAAHAETRSALEKAAGADGEGAAVAVAVAEPPAGETQQTEASALLSFIGNYNR